MPNPKLATLVESFTAPTLNTALWNSITGTATLDATVDLVTLAQPTSSGATNSFGSTNLYDATSSSLYALITPVANGNGYTKTALVLRADANNYVSLRVESGLLRFALQTAGATAITTFGIYDAHAHRWWRLREAAGTWYADTSADGITWSTQTSSAYAWSASATAMTFAFQTSANATEVSGLTASISCINTRIGGNSNPNWPVIEDGWGPYWKAGVSVVAGVFSEVTPRTRGTSSSQRGRQYELDQVRSGELNTTLANTDGVLDPANASSPYAGNILPYQAYRKRAQWPPTVNLLAQVLASGGDLGGVAAGTNLSGTDVASDTDGSGSATVTSSTSAWQGSTVLQVSVPNATATNARILRTAQPAALPGQTYTVQMRVRNVTASTSLQVKVGLGFYTTPGVIPAYTYSSPVTLTGSVTAPWSLLTFTATAPANALGLSVNLAAAATAAATCAVQVDGVQLEKAAAATAWVMPGIWYPMYTGYAERWPSSWRDGVYGTVAPTCVDAFALLSQVTLSDPLTQEIASHSPRFLYKLDDPQGSTSAADSTGNFPQAELAISKYGAGSLTFGNQISAASPTGTYTGSTGTVVTLDNPNPGAGVVAGATYLKLGSAGIKGPADPTLWVRTLAFRYTGPTPTAAAYMWSCMDGQRSGGTPAGARIWLYIDSAGLPRMWLAGPTGAGQAYVPGGVTNVVDGNWHWLIFGYNASTQQVIFSQDGSVSAYVGSVPSTYTPTGLSSDNLGGYVDTSVGGGTTQNFKGDISFAGELTGWVGSSDEITALYSAWKNSFTGESTNARYGRVLSYAGWSGPRSIGTGLTTSMGPADFAGQDALSALQAAVDTEGGTHFVDRSGTITFRARSARYNALTPTCVFGERADLGEYPYEDCKLDFDPTRLSNRVTVTQKTTGQTFAAQDQASIAAYFPRPLTRTINTSSAAECQDAASYLLSRYKQPVTRINTLKLHPSAQPALWPVLLSMELGARVRIMRRPPGLPAIGLDAFVESINWQMDDRGEAVVALQCSPVDATPYGVFAAWHTTLNASVASGVTSIVVTASADNTNPLAAQIGFGQQIVLGQNTANQETVTISSVSTTTAGWTTATLTLTAATTKAHTVGDLICEPLPAGITDPATWDATSQFDEIAFAY
ncbi:hypothetical protein [Streptomyces sp. NPDC001389]|uniref:hypothetical protein n=1 Tax=Streptomyces sp. NPDC001389 TaxID=3364569 RepID=UPI0036CAE248